MVCALLDANFLHCSVFSLGFYWKRSSILSILPPVRIYLTQKEAVPVSMRFCTVQTVHDNTRSQNFFELLVLENSFFWGGPLSSLMPQSQFVYGTPYSFLNIPTAVLDSESLMCVCVGGQFCSPDLWAHCHFEV